MVKTEIIIEYDKAKILNLTLNLLKREDWTEEEWQLANAIQENYLHMIDIMKKKGRMIELTREIIEEKKQKEK